MLPPAGGLWYTAISVDFNDNSVERADGQLSSDGSRELVTGHRRDFNSMSLGPLL